MLIIQRWRYSPVVLYASAFLFCTAAGTLMTVLPWRAMGLGGEAFAAGSVGAIWMGSYMLGCLTLGRFADIFGVKRMMLLSSAIMTLLLALLPLAWSLPVHFVLAGLCGLTGSIFIPPVVGWLSTGHEGTHLSRRLGLFNLSWSTGMIVGGWLSGILYEIAFWSPFVMASLATLGAFLTLVGARSKRTDLTDANPFKAMLPECDRLRTFRRMGRIALVASYVAIGAMRFPMASLIREMSYGADMHA
ncbi:MAG: MFS transporter, partial [Phycisphaerae bacterium]|nr:MFS transporter [Phycisphaerae bacterium]